MAEVDPLEGEIHQGYIRITAVVNDADIDLTDFTLKTGEANIGAFQKVLWLCQSVRHGLTMLRQPESSLVQMSITNRQCFFA